MRSTEGTLSRGRSPSAPRLDVTSLASVSHLAWERCGRISSPSTRGSLLCGWRSTGPCARGTWWNAYREAWIDMGVSDEDAVMDTFLFEIDQWPYTAGGWPGDEDSNYRVMH